MFRDNKVSVDVVATSEISVSLTLDPRCSSPNPTLPVAALVCRGILRALLPDALAFTPDLPRQSAVFSLDSGKGEDDSWPEAMIHAQQDLGARPD